MLGRSYLDAGKFGDAARLFQEALQAAPDNPALESDLGLACEGLRDEARGGGLVRPRLRPPLLPARGLSEAGRLPAEHRPVGKSGRDARPGPRRFPPVGPDSFLPGGPEPGLEELPARRWPASRRCVISPRRRATCSIRSTTWRARSFSAGSTRTPGSSRSCGRGWRSIPGNSDLMNELAFAWAESGTHLREALELGRRASQLDPENGAIADTLGWIYFKSGEANAALPYLQRAAVLTKNDPVVFTTSRRCLAGIGSPARSGRGLAPRPREKPGRTPPLPPASPPPWRQRTMLTYAPRPANNPTFRLALFALAFWCGLIFTGGAQARNYLFHDYGARPRLTPPDRIMSRGALLVDARTARCSTPAIPTRSSCPPARPS